MNTRSALYQRLLWEHRSVCSELARTQETLHQLQEQVKNAPLVQELLERIDGLTSEKSEFEGRHQDCTAAVDLERILSDRDRVNAGKVAKEKDEVIRLKGELEKLKKDHAKELENLKSASESEIAKHKELADSAVIQVSSVQKSLDIFKGQQKVWLSVLGQTQAAMRESFPESEQAAKRAVEKRWAKRAEGMPLESSWGIEDHLAALQARVKPMKVIGVDVFQAAIEMVKALWPEDKLPLPPSEIAERLQDGPERLDEWRASAGRVGADEALSYVLSWFETIPLARLKHMRDGSIYEKDPELKRCRQKLAYSYIEYADVHTFCDDIEAPKEGTERRVEDEDESSGDSNIDKVTTQETGTGDGSAAADIEKNKMPAETPATDIPSSSSTPAA